ncbi:putative quinol monooxygenase [Dictyobacter kobayashii]|uniref:ABM domain-containing protein n=1 Tax=Dictyobacter kobayashii TaxID=2014872 RepID=A0A402ALX1_9CHLR|nr:antibiotic biosynthesis monooxygenase [Dictyobacter kobayashii]GCE20151.1 hypothetical protein KDK_39510 [Dictyobacter kobayashii]
MDHTQDKQPSQLGSFVMLNIFEVEPNVCDELLNVLKEMTESIRHKPGFVSASFHVSFDKKQVINVSKYLGSTEQQAAMLQTPGHQEYIQRCKDLATSNRRIFTNVAFVATPEALEVVTPTLD